MSDLHEIAKRKIAAEREKLVAALPQSIEAAKRRQAARGGLQSGNTAAMLRDLCIEPMTALGVHINQEYKWAASTALFLTQSFARSLADSAPAEMQPLSDFCTAQLSSQLQSLNMANLRQELMQTLHSKQSEILNDVRIELDRSFAERRRGVVRNLVMGIGNLLSKVGGK